MNIILVILNSQVPAFRELVYNAHYSSIAEAKQRERKIKKMKSRKFIEGSTKNGGSIFTLPLFFT